MKALRIASWILIVISLIIKLLQLPFAGPLIVLGALLLFIHAIIFLIKNADTNLTDTFFHLNTSIWTIYFMFRFMYWPFAQIVFMLCVCATFVYIVLLGINKSRILYTEMILFTYIFALGILAYTQTYRIYYFFNLNPLLNEESKNFNYQAWDKYSWFLYGANKNGEALQANEKALYAAVEVLKTNPGIQQSVLLIQQHKQQITEKNWANYTRPF